MKKIILTISIAALLVFLTLNYLGTPRSYGSLYAYDLLPTANGRYELVTVGGKDFTGGTGASPALNADGTRVYTADNDHNVIAFDRDLVHLLDNSSSVVLVRPILAFKNGVLGSHAQELPDWASRLL